LRLPALLRDPLLQRRALCLRDVDSGIDGVAGGLAKALPLAAGVDQAGVVIDRGPLSAVDAKRAHYCIRRNARLRDGGLRHF
jgi:hypothetical protein